MDTIIKFFKTFTLDKAIVLLLSPLVLLFQNLGDMMVSLFALITIDLIMGIRVYVKTNNERLQLLKPSTWKHIKSAGLKKTTSKAKDYFLIIVATFVINTYIVKVPISFFDYNIEELVVVSLAVIEIWSIGENFRTLRGYNIFEFVYKIIKDKDWKKSLDDIEKNK